MMKKAVLVVVIIASLVAGSVLVGGFLQKNSKSKSASSNPVSSQVVNQSQAGNSSASSSSTTNSSTKTYTASEVSQHSSETDCWIIISNNAYDVTSFLSEHPGGAFEITPYCGKDATQAFETQGGRGAHSQTANEMLATYFIGTVK